LEQIRRESGSVDSDMKSPWCTALSVVCCCAKLRERERAELLQIGVKRPSCISTVVASTDITLRPAMIHTFHQLPLEIFYEIALHLPLTKHVLAFTLTNARIRRALLTPALFKARLSLRGWDVSAWKDEDDAVQSPGDLKHWMCIDHTYCRTAQLFEEAAVDRYFLITPKSPTDEAVLWRSASDPGQDNQSSDLRPVFDGDKTVIWLKKLSKVFPLFVTHHRMYNFDSFYNIHPKPIPFSSCRRG
jgi:hypothetical protein